MYRVNESDGSVEIKASLSNPSMTNITVQILSNDITAMSESLHRSHLIALHICVYDVRHTQTNACTYQC